MAHPATPQHLVGSKWTAQHPVARELHWVVSAYAAKHGVVTLEAVLTGRSRELPWRGLRDRNAWLPGWVQPTERA